MTRINNVDQLVLLLQERLDAASRKKRSAKNTKTGHTKAPTHTRDVSVAQDLLDSGNFTENDIQHALIQGILSQEFGDRLVNDANFQQVVNKVVEIIDRDPDMRKLLQESLQELGK